MSRASPSAARYSAAAASSRDAVSSRSPRLWRETRLAEAISIAPRELDALDEQLASTTRVPEVGRDRPEQLDAAFHAQLVPQLTMDRQRLLEAPAGELRPAVLHEARGKTGERPRNAETVSELAKEHERALVQQLGLGVIAADSCKDSDGHDRLGAGVVRCVLAERQELGAPALALLEQIVPHPEEGQRGGEPEAEVDVVLARPPESEPDVAELGFEPFLQHPSTRPHESDDPPPRQGL